MFLPEIYFCSATSSEICMTAIKFHFGLLLQARAPPGQEPQNLPAPYDSQHETERKRQLLKLFNRTQEQVQLSII